MKNNCCRKGLRWFQSDIDAIDLGKVFFVFNPSKNSSFEKYSEETLIITNKLIKFCLELWKIHGINDLNERNAVENLQRQYYNNQKRIYHFQCFYRKQIRELSIAFSKLTIV